MFTDKYMGSITQIIDSLVLDLKPPFQKPVFGGRGRGTGDGGRGSRVGRAFLPVVGILHSLPTTTSPPCPTPPPRTGNRDQEQPAPSVLVHSSIVRAGSEIICKPLRHGQRHPRCSGLSIIRCCRVWGGRGFNAGKGPSTLFENQPARQSRVRRAHWPVAASDLAISRARESGYWVPRFWFFLP